MVCFGRDLNINHDYRLEHNHNATRYSLRSRVPRRSLALQSMLSLAAYLMPHPPSASRRRSRPESPRTPSLGSPVASVFFSSNRKSSDSWNSLADDDTEAGPIKDAPPGAKRSWWAIGWYTVLAAASILLLVLFIKGFIDADDVEVRLVFYRLCATAPDCHVV